MSEKDLISPDIIENLLIDSSFRLDEAKSRKALKKSKALASPVNLSNKMQTFRQKYLPTLKLNSSVRETIIRTMEAEIRIKSEALEKKLTNKKAVEEYDLIIVGSGVHGIIALQSALKKNSNYKILLVEASDTAGANFRYAKDTFNINSSNRMSAEDKLPLPGVGNINELPKLPIQVSDISAVKYPTAGDLGAAIVVGMYSAATSYKNVDILLNSTVQPLRTIKIKSQQK